MQYNFVDLIGKRFGRLTVIKRAENDKYSTARWLCKCDCGGETITSSGHLNSGHTKSCGCFSREVASEKALKNKCFYTHGLSNNKTFRRISYIRASMKARCYNPKNHNYPRYGGRGIKICDEWLNSENGMINFYNWAINNGYQDNLTIDRIDVNGNYEPGNCRWATAKEQANNKRNNITINYKGEIIKLTDIAEKMKINPRILRDRLRRGWTVERTIEQRPGHKKRVIQYDLQNNFIKTFNSITDAQNTTGITSIGQCCRRVCETAGGYKWRFADENNSKFSNNCRESNQRN